MAISPYRYVRSCVRGDRRRAGRAYETFDFCARIGGHGGLLACFCFPCLETGSACGVDDGSENTSPSTCISQPALGSGPRHPSPHLQTRTSFPKCQHPTTTTAAETPVAVACATGPFGTAFSHVSFLLWSLHSVQTTSTRPFLSRQYSCCCFLLFSDHWIPPSSTLVACCRRRYVELWERGLRTR